MKLIVGLGNPEERYEDTRHNVGFRVVDHLAKSFTQGPEVKYTDSKKYKAHIYTIVYKDEKLLLIKPQTYMNNSGWSVKPLVDMYKLEPKDVWVIHDDLDLPLGKLRIRLGGASAGHRGVDSIIEQMGTDQFTRFRVGIGRGKKDSIKSTDHNVPRQEIEKFVLSPFTESEVGDMRKMIKHTAEAIETTLDKGLEKAMNRFN